MTDSDLLQGDDDVAEALHRLAEGLPLHDGRALAEVRARGRRRQVRDRVVAGGGALALVFVALAGAQQLRPLGAPVVDDVAGTGEVAEPSTAAPLTDEPTDADPTPPAALSNVLPPAAGPDEVDLEELRAWYDLYWRQVDEGAAFGIGDGAGLHIGSGIELLAGVPDPRAGASSVDGPALADDVAAYRADGLAPGGFLLDTPELADLLRRLESTVRAHSDGSAGASLPTPAGTAGVDVGELRGWAVLARDGELDRPTSEVARRAIELLAAPAFDTTDLDLLVEDVRALVATPVGGPVDDLHGRLLTTLEREQAAGPVPTAAPSSLGPGLTPEEVHDWTRLSWTQAGSPGGIVTADGVGRLLSLTLELQSGAPDPRDDGFWSADAGITASELLAEARAYLAQGRTGFLADRPDLVTLVERLVVTLEQLAEA